MRLNTQYTTVAAVVAMTAMACLAPRAEAAGEWQTSWHAAQRLAKKTGRPILINFTGSDWCGYCIRLHKNVFATPEFKKWAKANVILLVIDFPRDRAVPKDQKNHDEALKQHYEVRGYPTIVFVNAEGAEKGRLQGYGGDAPADWIKRAATILKG